ncbi:MAG: hypothetical protein DYG89_18200 [Caldilinea sp. CFX5]|nr:hypothetical protein [Caldilinea sp. CFX5]
MNTMTFVFGQLLTLEMLAAGRQPIRQHLHNRLRNKHRSTQHWKGIFMDNSMLVILFLIVTLIANFAMPSRTE